MKVLGDEGIKIYNTISEVDIQKSYVNVMTFFENYFVPKTNFAMEAFKFYSITQNEGQTYENFLSEIRNQRNQASHCSFVCTKAGCNTKYENRMIYILRQNYNKRE